MTALRGIKIEDYKAWLDNPLTKALKQSHAHQVEQRDALLRQVLDEIEHHGGHLSWNAFVELRHDIRQHLETST